MKKVRKISSKVAYEHEPFITIREDEVVFPTGLHGVYSVAECADFAMIVPIDENNNTYLVKQHRYPIDASPIEFAAGRIDPGEDPIEAAHRELREELGLKAREMYPLAMAWASGGRSTNKAHFFLARGIEDLGEQQLDETESIDIIKVPYEDLDAMIEAEDVNDNNVLAARYYVDRFLQKETQEKLDEKK